MSLKDIFLSFIKQDLCIPLAGVASPDDYSEKELDGITSLVKSFSKLTALPDETKKPKHPREILEEMKSIIIVAVPNYMNRPMGFNKCRDELLGTASPLHISTDIIERARERNSSICSFFTDRGFACRPVAGTSLFPLKIMASRCGIGCYGKNSMILHPEYGSWLSLTGFITDALLETDKPINGGGCGACDLCVKACPAGALHTPFRCDETRCINSHLGHNKGCIPKELRPACRNLIGQACTTCKDVCPKNHGLKPVEDCDVPNDMLHPKLLDIVNIDDAQWKKTFGRTMMGLTMRSKKYLKRNAAIALGNFKEERGIDSLSYQLENGEDEIRGYAAWALGRIGSPPAFSKLERALQREKNQEVKDEITAAHDADRKNRDIYK